MAFIFGAMLPTTVDRTVVQKLIRSLLLYSFPLMEYINIMIRDSNICYNTLQIITSIIVMCMSDVTLNCSK